jgi:hypothetical protein
MRKAFCLFCTVILLVCSLCGCVNSPGENPGGDTIPDGSTVKDPDDKNTEESAFAALQKKIAQSGSAVAVAFIGYVDSESSEADLRAYVAGSETGKEYPSLSSAPLYMAEGQELYAIIPPNDKGTIIVYPSMITEDGEYADDKNNPLHVGEPGEPLLLRCNLSEIYSNVLIAATDGGGAMDFRPSLSMENGHLQEIAGVYDFSTYEEVPDERSIQIATELLLETEEVKQAVMQGMKVMYTGDTQWIEGRPCLLFALGTDSEEQFVRERYYGVCDNLVYRYDAISDTWSTVGRQ